MAKSKWYCVIKGRQPGIYRSYTECQKQTDRFRGAVFKSFATKEDMNAYIEEMKHSEEEEMERAEEERTQYMENEQAAEERRIARELLARNQGEVEAVESFFDESERRAHVDNQRAVSESSSATVQSDHSIDSSPKSSHRSDTPGGEDDWSTGSSSSFGTELELRPSKKLKPGHGTGTVPRQGAGVPKTSRHGKPN
ncbi:hypothetical protein CEP54_016396, partial [Fusarium duplospermum]